MRNVCGALSVLLLSCGCAYIPEQKVKFPSMLDPVVTRKQSFEDLLSKHRYVVAKSNAQQPSVIFIGDVHSKPLRQRHCVFLKDVVKNGDSLLLEGYAGDFGYEDLHNEAFLKGELPENLQGIIRENAKSVTHGTAARQELYYKDLSDKIYGLEDAVLKAFQFDSFFGMKKKIDDPVLYDLYAKRHLAAFYCRNIAMARTVAHHFAQSGDGEKVYVLLGVQHLLTSEELKQHGIVLKSAGLETLAGHVVGLLESVSVPYSVVVPVDIANEKKLVDANPSLGLDYETRESLNR